MSHEKPSMNYEKPTFYENEMEHLHLKEKIDTLLEKGHMLAALELAAKKLFSDTEGPKKDLSVKISILSAEFYERMLGRDGGATPVDIKDTAKKLLSFIEEADKVYSSPQ